MHSVSSDQNGSSSGALPNNVLEAAPLLFADMVECLICMDTIFPCEVWTETDCFPNRHILHLDCYNEYLKVQPCGPQATRCPVCRQFELGEMQVIDLSVIFGFDSEALFEIDQFPAEAQEYARSFQRGEITQEQLEAMADENRPAMEEDDK